MRGGGASGVFLLASWRLGFTLFLWIATIFFILLIFKCLKSLALALKDQGLTILGHDPPRNQVCSIRNHGRELPGNIRSGGPLSLPSEYSLRTSRIPATPLTHQHQLPNTLNFPAAPPPYSVVAPPSLPPLDLPPAYDSLYPATQNKDQDQDRDNLPPV